MSDFGGIIKGIPASEFDFVNFRRKTTERVTSATGGAQIEFDFSEMEKKVAEYINDNAETIAKQIARDARAKIHSVTGNLRKRVRAKKSKFDDGGWIVVSTAPHSMLVEYGGENVRQPLTKKFMKFEKYGAQSGTFYGKEVAKMPAKPFLRPALNENIAAAKRLFGAK
jgi:HK97 gp10 family phage protein